ncbi:MAG: OmpA family protein [Deltaproteobacteria bacterium]|nr:OmpA family protein [Deltaproteobacteria bacterium]
MASSVAAFRILAVVAVAGVTFGCAETAQLRGGITTARRKLEQIEKNGAYVCAPKELAIAKANLKFAELEIEQGFGRAARRHYDVAIKNAELADQKSPPDKCAGPAVVVAECVDTDKDGVCDDMDRCPDQPGPPPDGCPKDLDGDGIIDALDQCILDPEDKDGYLDDDGCPDLDNDLDGIPDTADRCPNDPEDPDGFEDTDGCPDPDNDQDTVPDVTDECPNQKGEVANNGCPKKYEGVEITDTHIRINQTIHFAYNKATIKPDSFPILNTVAQVLRDYPEITVSVEGHTDSRGNDSFNKKLSDKRAKAVMDYLMKNGGIAKSRLQSKGWGEEKPIDSNLTEEGRAANRRVEFVRTDVPSRE